MIRRGKQTANGAKNKCRKAYQARYYQDKKQKKAEEASKVAESVRLNGANHIAREKLNTFLQDRGPLKSFVMHDVLQNNPELLKRLPPFLDPVFESEVQSEKGISVSCDTACGSESKPNVDCGKALRQYYGNKVESEGTDDGYEERYCYGTGCGHLSTGICKSQFVNRSIDSNMNTVKQLLQGIVYKDARVAYDCNVNTDDDLNHLTLLVYCNKYKEVKRKNQMGFHTDMQTVRKCGRWVYDAKKNSQKENTLSIIVNLGDSRILQFQEYHKTSGGANKAKKTGKKPIKFLLDHGSVFVLHPQDEIPMTRFGRKTMETFFMHGGVEFGGDDKMSLALCFRVSAHTDFFDKHTGHVKINGPKKETWIRRDNQLSEYLADNTQVVGLHTKLLNMYTNMKNRYLVKT